MPKKFKDDEEYKPTFDYIPVRLKLLATANPEDIYNKINEIILAINNSDLHVVKGSRQHKNLKEILDHEEK